VNPESDFELNAGAKNSKSTATLSCLEIQLFIKISGMKKKT
jgi:hypothetical protein